MKIEELSIGDWVVAELAKWDYDSPEETEPMRIVCIDNSEPKQAFADLTLDEVRITHSALIDDLRPIPLTPEILKKNGFVKITEDMVWAEHLNPKLAEIPTWGLKIGERPVPYLVAKMRDNNRFEITTTNIKLFRFNVGHVHQLQHVLRLAGIEKDIEL